MQVEISFILNVKKEITEEELKKELDKGCPLEIKDNTLFEVSTENWNIVG